MSAYCSECQRPLSVTRPGFAVSCINHPEAPVDETPGPPEEPEESCTPEQMGAFAAAFEESIPSTETLVTSEDFLPTSSEATGRAEFFKAMAFEADRRMKELELKQATLEAQCAAATKSVTVIQKRIKAWVEQHWATPTDETMQMMLGLLAETKRVL